MCICYYLQEPLLRTTHYLPSLDREMEIVSIIPPCILKKSHRVLKLLVGPAPKGLFGPCGQVVGYAT